MRNKTLGRASEKSEPAGHSKTHYLGVESNLASLVGYVYIRGLPNNPGGGTGEHSVVLLTGTK